jgi:hypothetical protein
MNEDFDSQLLGLLSTPGPNGERLVRAIRDGHWDPVYFRRLESELRQIRPLAPVRLSLDAQCEAMIVVGVAFAKKDYWPFPKGSPEYAALSSLVLTLVEIAALGDR